MFKTFIAELKWIFSKKIRLIEWIVIIFIPFIYGFFYINAYWAPFNNVDKLEIAIINRDTSVHSNDLVNNIVDRKTIEVGSKSVDINIKELKDIYDPRGVVEDGELHAAIIVPEGYGEYVDGVLSNVAQILIDFSNGDLNSVSNILEKESSLITDEEFDKVTFYNSYKHNYLAGEMTNFGADLTKLSLSTIFPISSSNEDIVKIGNTIEKLSIGSTIVEQVPIGANIDTYGFGLSPYFISIALWAGALVMTFMFKNVRRVKDVSTIRHYFGKSLIWILTSFLQSTVLMIAMTIQGVYIGPTQWQLFAFAWLMGVVFVTIIQGIAYSIRYGDIGEFIVIILLVFQLVSSSGTFPVEMETEIFNVFHPLIPFTYTVDSIREILYMPNLGVLFSNIGILMLFPIAITPLALFINIKFDKKTIKEKGSPISFEIETKDL